MNNSMREMSGITQKSESQKSELAKRKLTESIHIFCYLIYTVHAESLHSASLFPHFDIVTALFQNRLNSLLSSTFYKQYPIMTM